MVAAMLLGDLFATPRSRTSTSLPWPTTRGPSGPVRSSSARGLQADGHRYAPEAVANGAVALVVDHPLDLPIAQVLVDDVRAAMAPAAARLDGDPTAELAMVGITGTNGKTTTAYLTRALLEGGRPPDGADRDRHVVVGGAEQPGRCARRPRRSTCSPRSARCSTATTSPRVMEVSSHALSLHRADAIHCDVAVFTNLTQDHLDFHTDDGGLLPGQAPAVRRRLEHGATLIASADDRLRRAPGARFPAGGDDRDRRRGR